MIEELERCKDDDLIVLECERCGHRDQAWRAGSHACRFCGGGMVEAPDFEAEDLEYPRHEFDDEGTF